MKQPQEITLLIVDDDDIGVASVQRAMRKLGMSNPVRVGRNGLEALEQLQAAARLAPQEMRYGYVYALALDSQKQTAKAIVQLQALAGLHPQQPELLVALVEMLSREQRLREALEYAQQLQRLQPQNRQLRLWIARLRGALQ